MNKLVWKIFLRNKRNEICISIKEMKYVLIFLCLLVIGIPIFIGLIWLVGYIHLFITDYVLWFTDMIKGNDSIFFKVGAADFIFFMSSFFVALLIYVVCWWLRDNWIEAKREAYFEKHELWK